MANFDQNDQRTTCTVGKISYSMGIMASNPDPIDIHVGSRVRLRRTLLGMSQSKLGAALGLSFQQIQKYERGANRIGSSRLFRLSRILNVPVAYFFEELPEGIIEDIGATPSSGKAPKPDQLSRRLTLELVRAFYQIPSEVTRKRLFELTKTLAKAS